MSTKKDDAAVLTATPSGITDGQVEKAVDVFRSQLHKHKGELQSEAFQTVLGQSELGLDLFRVVLKRLEAVGGMIVRRVHVDRTLAPQAVLDATGRKQYTNSGAVKEMPRGEGEEVDVCFFKLGRYVSDADLEKEYELRGLVPADPYSLAAVNAADPGFADEHPNGTHWQDAKGKWCFAAFYRWDVGREVVVDRDDCDWRDDWWFGGLRK